MFHYLLKRRAGAALLALAVSGCANNPFQSYSAVSGDLITKVRSGNVSGAMQPRDTDDLLFNMEYGLLLRMDRRFDASNVYLGRAETISDAWAASWNNTTSGKAASTAVSMLVNDNANAYEPKGFERVFLPLFTAMNHLPDDDYDKARIGVKRMYQFEQATEAYYLSVYEEARAESREKAAKAEAGARVDPAEGRVNDEILKKYNFEDIKTPEVLALTNSYQNAFGHYLAGFVFEALNEPSLARPGYVKAGKLNPSLALARDSIDAIDAGDRPARGTTELLIVQEVGTAPTLRSVEERLLINIAGKDERPCMHMVTLFFPKLEGDPAEARPRSIEVAGRKVTPAQVTNVHLMAARALVDDTPRLVARNVSSAVRNLAMTRASCSNEKAGVGALLNLGSLVTGALLDRADERSLTLLPGAINIQRMNLPQGSHRLSVMVNGRSHEQTITLDKPYQVIAHRIVGDQVYFYQPRNTETP